MMCSLLFGSSSCSNSCGRSLVRRCTGIRQICSSRLPSWIAGSFSFLFSSPSHRLLVYSFIGVFHSHKTCYFLAAGTLYSPLSPYFTAEPRLLDVCRPLFDMGGSTIMYKTVQKVPLIDVLLRLRLRIVQTDMLLEVLSRPRWHVCCSDLSTGIFCYPWRGSLDVLSRESHGVSLLCCCELWQLMLFRFFKLSGFVSLVRRTGLGCIEHRGQGTKALECVRLNLRARLTHNDPIDPHSSSAHRGTV